MKKFLYHMLKESCETKWFYDSTIYNLIDFIEHRMGINCPIEKTIMIEEFKKALQLTRETTT